MNYLDIYKDQTILVTGGTGSFGKKFIETILKKSLTNQRKLFILVVEIKG